MASGNCWADRLLWLLSWPQESNIEAYLVHHHRIPKIRAVRLADVDLEQTGVKRGYRIFLVQKNQSLGGVVVFRILATDDEAVVVRVAFRLEAIEGVVAVVADDAVKLDPEGVGLGDGVGDGDAVHPEDEVGDGRYVGLIRTTKYR